MPRGQVRATHTLGLWLSSPLPGWRRVPLEHGLGTSYVFRQKHAITGSKPVWGLTVWPPPSSESMLTGVQTSGNTHSCDRFRGCGRLLGTPVTPMCVCVCVCAGDCLLVSHPICEASTAVTYTHAPRAHRSPNLLPYPIPCNGASGPKTQGQSPLRDSPEVLLPGQQLVPTH